MSAPLVADMSAHVLVNLLTSWRKKIQCEVCQAFLSLIRNEFNKFNNTSAQLLDSFYYMTLRLH